MSQNNHAFPPGKGGQVMTDDGAVDPPRVRGEGLARAVLYVCLGAIAVMLLSLVMPQVYRWLGW